MGITKYFPETDMFLILEMSYQANNVDTTHTVQNGLTLVHIKKLNHDVKYALAMYKSRLGEPYMRVGTPAHVLLFTIMKKGRIPLIDITVL